VSVTSFTKTAVVKIGWTTISYALVQAIRLLNNIVLARILAPPLFGLMLIVNTIRVGIELLSDVGIGQNIVSNPKGSTPEFLDTAWTLQVARGLVLGLACFFSSNFLAESFGHPELSHVLPIAALFFIFTGFDSTGRFLAQKHLLVKRLSIFEVGIALFSFVTHVTLALITPTIWALVLGSVLTGAAALIASFFLVPGLRHRIMIDPPSVRELITFGKWIFLSSIVYFLAMNFDRLYLSLQISLTQLGIFGIARTLADMVSLFVSRCGSLLLFPMVAAMNVEGAEVRRRLQGGRRQLLLATAIALGLFVAVADLVVALLYDSRYQAAGSILPVLLLGTWFAILTTVNESILIGVRKPAGSALANVAKFLFYLGAVPLAFGAFGLSGAIVVLSAGEVAKYAVLWFFGRREHLGFGRDDLALTAVFLLSILGFRSLLATIGVTRGLGELFPEAAAMLAAV